MKRRNLLMAATIMCGLFTIAFTFDANAMQWLWQGKEAVAVLLGVAALVFGMLWLKQPKTINNRK